jgi:hypothetical protein
MQEILRKQIETLIKITDSEFNLIKTNLKKTVIKNSLYLLITTILIVVMF